MIKVQKDIDMLLGGGLQPRNITHIYGVPASGKTNIALIATVNATRNGKVIYIDPEGGFSVERVKQISKDRLDEVLRNLMLIEPTEFDEQKVAISKLDDLIQEHDVSLIVVDSIAVLYRLEKDKNIKELGRQLAQLLRAGRKYNIPILMTNQVYTDINSGTIVPVGGDIIRYWAKIIIELERNEAIRAAVLRKHKFLPEGLKFEFRITNDGIETIGMGIEDPQSNASDYQHKPS